MRFFEDQYTELKESIRSGTLVNEIVAFLNTNDGVIYIGVDNDGFPIGIEKLDEDLQTISNILSNQIEPNPRAFINVGNFSDEDKAIIKIDIKKGTELYYVKKYGLSVSGCFERVGTTCRGMTTEQIKWRFAATISIPERTMVNTPCLRTDLTFNRLKAYFASKNVHYNVKHFNENNHFLTPDGRFNILAELLSDEHMKSIKVAVFKGTDKTSFINRNEYGHSCILYALDAVTQYCEALNNTYIDTSVRPRREKKMFDEAAFEEAWINAMVHNKWVDGIPPAVYWFDDRMEIVSYGGIPAGLTKEQFLSGKTKPVNKELMDIFAECDIVEQNGHGVPIVVSKYGDGAYEFLEDMIIVTIPFDKTGFKVEKTGSTTQETTKEIEGTTQEIANTTQETTQETQNTTQETTQEIANTTQETQNTTQEKIIKAMIDNPKITRAELSETLRITDGGIKYHLTKLKKEGKIEHIGSTKSGKWVIKE